MVSYHPWESFVFDVKGKMDRGELVPDPEWQRGYIWKLKDEQLLIDSIYKQLPIPKFYLTQEYVQKRDVSIHYVVDGQQRLKAIHGFLTNKFPIKVGRRQCYFRDLDSETQKRITNYKLDGHYLVDFKQGDINFLFERLNRTGIKLTNIEVWNNAYFGTKILKMIKEIYEEICGFPKKRDYRDYDEKDYDKLRSSYVATIYAEENIKRMLPLDDIIDLCNCLEKGAVEGGGKRELEAFLTKRKNIPNKQCSTIKSKFKKVLINIKEIFSREDLESSAYSKRTHFISLFLAVAMLIPKYYILSNTKKLKKALLDFIENQPEEYKESVLGAIRQKAAREKRAGSLKNILKKNAKELDKNRFFEKSLKQKFWREYNNICQICQKEIRKYKDSTLDHIEPWAKGGRTKENNAQLAHIKCNKKKRDKFEEFVLFD